MKIFQDAIGLYGRCGGYLCRPAIATNLKAGDTVPAKHIGGTQLIAIGKRSNKKENYPEYWVTHGDSSKEENKTNVEKTNYERVSTMELHFHLFKQTPAAAELKRANEYLYGQAMLHSTNFKKAP
jgi:hypothetical protein